MRQIYFMLCVNCYKQCNSSTGVYALTMKNPPSLKPYFDKKHHQHLRKLDYCLVLYEESLVELNSDQHYQLERIDDPKIIAAAARRLLPAADSKKNIALCLPSHEFIATQAHLPGVGSENLHSALLLQKPMLLPGYSAPLLLAVHAQPQDDGHYLVLWFSAQRADDLFQAFAEKNLHLSLFLPRPLVLLQNANSTQHVYDEDSMSITYARWENNQLVRWLWVDKQDYEQDNFRQQLEADLTADEPLEDAQWQRKNQLKDWENLPHPPTNACFYSFIAPQAEQQQIIKQRKQRWRLFYLSLVLLLLVVLGAGAWLWYQQYQLQQEIVQLKDETKDIENLRQGVFAIEDEIGPIALFPEQDVISLLQQLNALVPKNSWITRMKIEGGIVEIEGNSPEPVKILESLANSELFTDVAFNQPIRGQRFGISMQIVGVDVKSYLETYFPDQVNSE